MSRPAVLSGPPSDLTAAPSVSRSSPALLNLMAVPLGVASFGGVWQALRSTLDAPAWPAGVLFALSTALWVLLSAMYVIRVWQGSGTFADDRRDVFYGPFSAYVPVIGILVASHYEQYAQVAGQIAVAVFVAALAVLLAQLLGYWLVGNLRLAGLHPGYLLPTVAGPFIASLGLGISGWRQAAEGAFGVGAFLWLIFGGLIFGRLAFGEPLPDLLKPLLSILVSAPAAGGIAWFVIAGGRLGAVGYVLLGITVMMLLVQVVIFSGYRGLRFTPTFWAFTFPAGASTTLIIRWISSESLPGWRAWCWALAGVATAGLLAIVAATVADRARPARQRTASPEPGHDSQNWVTKPDSRIQS